MSVSANLNMICNVVEQIAVDADSVSGSGGQVTHNQFNSTATYTGSTGVPVTKVSAQVLALSTGAKTLDLSALLGINGGAVNATGLKLQIWLLKNLGANDMTFTFGASNPYEALGPAFLFVLKTGQVAQFFLNDSAPDVGSGAKSIDVTGTASQTFQSMMVFG